MKQMGAYDRLWLVREGLLRMNGCGDAGAIRILADSDQRTRETARALAEGLVPSCPISIASLAEGRPDPLFHPVEAGVAAPDRERAVAAVAGRMGGDPAAVTEAWRPQLQLLQQILEDCPAGARCNPAKPRSLLDLGSSLAPGKTDHIVDLHTPLAVASTMTENFLLEYCEGMASGQVGWGRVTPASLRDLLQLHVAQEDLAGRTEAIARAQSSALLFSLLQSIRQAAGRRPVRRALTRPSDKVLILSGHDTNLVNIAGALHLNWIVDGRRDDTPPGGALVFELWRRKGARQDEVRVWYMAQTLDQMRNATTLTLENPPLRLPVFLPACGKASGACDLSGFEHALKTAIDKRFVPKMLQ